MWKARALAHVCLSKKNRQALNNRTVEIDDEASDHGIPDKDPYPELLVTRAMKLSEEDRDAFVRKLQELGAEIGFLEA
jgi:hypothetical protein